MVSLSGHDGFTHVKFVGILLAGVTAATLAPCRTAFFNEFFVYQALANSAMPRRIKRIKKSTRAVSINVCPSQFLLTLIMFIFQDDSQLVAGWLSS
jgi:hypothetical protein